MMRDPFGSFGNMMKQFAGFRGNPMQMLMQSKLNIPQNIQNNPGAILQYMMDSGQLSQNQYNQASKAAQQIQNNPQFAQFVNRK